jgi:NADH-quinone oxidoreductase subunit N
MNFFYSFIPEIFLSFAILFQLVFNAAFISNSKNNYPVLNKELISQILFILFCLLLLYSNLKVEGSFFNNLFINDENTRLVKIFCVLIYLLITPILFENYKSHKLSFFEYFSLIFFSLFSLLLLISSSDMLSAYLLIEVQALSFYVLASFKRNSSFGTEASFKYFVSGSFISGIFLLGCSLLYGLLGTLNFNSLYLLLSIPFDSNNFIFLSILNFSFILITSTFLFKLSAAPFHFWSPDVYEGSSLSSTIVFAILPKLAIFNFLIRWLLVLDNNFLSIKLLLLISGVLSVVLGTLFSLYQKRLKRFIIFSSIAQTGFLISCLSVITINSLIAVYFFLVIYLLTSILIWSNFSFAQIWNSKTINFYNYSENSLFLSSLSNYLKFNSLWYFSFILIFFSLAGIPPLSGFFAKIFILFGLISEKLIAIAALLIFISAVSVFYYLRILKIMGFESNNNLKYINNSQVVYASQTFFLTSSIVSFLLFLLLYIFFYPVDFLLLSQYTTLSLFSL